MYVLFAKLSFFLYIGLCTLHGLTGEVVRRTVVEGVSRNVNILCNLDLRPDTLYWNITDRVYDLYSVPEIFTFYGQEQLIIPDVNRRMDNWSFQCFNIGRNRLNGQTTVMTVLFSGKYNIAIQISYVHDSYHHQAPNV